MTESALAEFIRCCCDCNVLSISSENFVKHPNKPSFWVRATFRGWATLDGKRLMCEAEYDLPEPMMAANIEEIARKIMRYLDKFC